MCLARAETWALRVGSGHHSISLQKFCMVVFARSWLTKQPKIWRSITKWSRTFKFLSCLVLDETVMCWFGLSEYVLPIDRRKNVTLWENVLHCLKCMLQLGHFEMYYILAMSVLWLGIFQICFHTTNLHCLMASGFGFVGYFLTLQSSKNFRKNKKMFWKNPSCRNAGCACRASTPLVLLLVQNFRHWEKSILSCNLHFLLKHYSSWCCSVLGESCCSLFSRRFLVSHFSSLTTDGFKHGLRLCISDLCQAPQ